MAKKEEFTEDQKAEIAEMIADAVAKATGAKSSLKSVPDFGEDKEFKTWGEKDKIKATFTSIAPHHKPGDTITRAWADIKQLGQKGIVENPEFIEKYEYKDPNQSFKRS